MPRYHRSVFALIALVFTSAARLIGASTSPAQTVEKWDTLTLSFRGPEATESGELNPFTDVGLSVKFIHDDVEYRIPGFYAADGNAAETGADTGNVWQVRFTPDRVGDWTWSAQMLSGPDAVLADDATAEYLEPHELEQSTGEFVVVPSAAEGRDFRAHGRLHVDTSTGYFVFQDSDRHWLKGGADSPENLLGYQDFDGSYRHSEEFREGENRPNESLHTYSPHVGDWRDGDPTWQSGKGKGLIGALNYLASTGMNAVYFLTLNIDGDGKDVWPYLNHTHRDRFDCSKLDQWEIVFQHMSRLGLLMHVVTQETENERLLDGGFTGRERRIYYRELIARFGHHLGLVWNLGEENGPANFSPHGQTTAQQKAMADYFKATDAYQHPVVVHTHSTAEGKTHIQGPLLKHPALDGVSFQVDEPERVHAETLYWKQRSRESGHPWLITMDEIGPWHTGAVPDADDPAHDSLRHHVLWGSLMAGAAGVEWYFGARYDHNDLSAEDWRSRANLWSQTRHALDFFRRLPFAHMTSADDLTDRPDDHILAYPDIVYALYLPDSADTNLNLGSTTHDFTVQWFDPVAGGDLRPGDTATIRGPGSVSIGRPPERSAPHQDWAVLIRRH